MAPCYFRIWNQPGKLEQKFSGSKFNQGKKWRNLSDFKQWWWHWRIISSPIGVDYHPKIKILVIDQTICVRFHSPLLLNEMNSDHQIDFNNRDQPFDLLFQFPRRVWHFVNNLQGSCLPPADELNGTTWSDDYEGFNEYVLPLYHKLNLPILWLNLNLESLKKSSR